MRISARRLGSISTFFAIDFLIDEISSSIARTKTWRNSLIVSSLNITTSFDTPASDERLSRRFWSDMPLVSSSTMRALVLSAFVSSKYAPSQPAEVSSIIVALRKETSRPAMSSLRCPTVMALIMWLRAIGWSKSKFSMTIIALGLSITGPVNVPIRAPPFQLESYPITSCDVFSDAKSPPFRTVTEPSRHWAMASERIFATSVLPEPDFPTIVNTSGLVRSSGGNNQLPRSESHILDVAISWPTIPSSICLRILATAR